eukprot:scaffold3687_cov240-Pinguiococcus_pyrenoidosus.AAC.8
MGSVMAIFAAVSAVSAVSRGVVRKKQPSPLSSWREHQDLASKLAPDIQAQRFLEGVCCCACSAAPTPLRRARSSLGRMTPYGMFSSAFRLPPL